jgi:alpha-D-xyloside xylohydrolase
VPFWLTTGGYGVLLHTSNRVTAWAGSRAGHQVQVAVDDDVLDYFVLLGSPADVLAGYTALTGRAPVPPAWSFGWWQSRCSYSSAEEVLGVVREMRQAGIPMDVVHLSLWQLPYLVEGTRLHDRLARADGFVGPARGACSTSASTSSAATRARCTWWTGPTRRRCG